FGKMLIDRGCAPLSGPRKVYAEVALLHHERWDGLGYPLGLAGKEIPQLARVTSVADGFDALVSVRTYKPAWTMECAIEAISSQRGRQFDPEVVDAFLEVCRARSMAPSNAEPDFGLGRRSTKHGCS